MSLTVITPEAAAAERVRREMARRNLVDFACYVAPWYRPAGVHRLVAQYLEQVLLYIETKGAEGIGRLMVFMPPRHGKTELVSRMFPAWLLGNLSNSRVIVTSYGADLAQDDSKAVRSYVTSERYAALFGQLSAVDDPVQLSQDTRSKANWDLEAPHRGGVVAAGVGGGITGKGAHLLVIDDPFKNRDEAESEAHRRRVTSWYQSSAYTRLEDGGAVIIVHTRWHPDDLAGVQLQAMADDPLADRWEVVMLPALALSPEQYPQSEREKVDNLLRGLWLPDADPMGRKPGAALWPEKYGPEQMERIQANVGDYDFESLYQQLPRPFSGGFFDEKDFEVVPAAPRGLTWYRYVDLALGRTQTSDWNATLAIAMDEHGDIYYRDMLRVRELTEFVEQTAHWMVSEPELGTVWGFEDVAFQSLVLQELRKRRELANVAMLSVKPQGDKVSRARALQARAKQGKVKLVRGVWVKEFLREVLTFPGGRHDDQVDTASGGLQMVAEQAGRKRAARSFQG